jgi:hypothetical protein
MPIVDVDTGLSGLQGNSSLTGDAVVAYELLASLSGGSTLTAAATEADHLTVFPPIVGTSMIAASLTWKAHPGAPPLKPTVNAATTLQQFIDATGSGRSITKTPSASHSVVDPNPPRKPFTPR